MLEKYARVVISGKLQALSNLHIGTGEEAIVDNGPKDICNTVAVDAKGFPYLPGSTLRGYLRSQVTDEEQRKTIFGYARQKRGSEDGGQAGQLRVYDARVVRSAGKLDYVSRTAIDSVTGAAKDHHLFTYQLVGQGTEFSIHLELDNTDTDTVKALLVALAGFSGAMPGQLGKGKSVGQGILAWTLDEVNVLTDEKLLQWLLLKPPTAPAKKQGKKYKKSEKQAVAQAPGLSPDRKFRSLWSNKTELFKKVSPAESCWKSIDFAMAVQSPVLIADPQLLDHWHQLPEACKSKDWHDTSKVPDLLFMRRGNQALLPGSSLKGWARAQCRRILVTLCQNSSGNAAEELLDYLFGGAQTGQGLLRFNEASAEFSAQDIHLQTFNAIDRFTGGVKKSALYTVEAVWPTRFTTRIHYDYDAMHKHNWAKLLLLYLLRDAHDGDLVLGWGKSKGYGRLMLTQEVIVFESFTENTLGEWHQQLLAELCPVEETA